MSIHLTLSRIWLWMAGGSTSSKQIMLLIQSIDKTRMRLKYPKKMSSLNSLNITMTEKRKAMMRCRLLVSKMSRRSGFMTIELAIGTLHLTNSTISKWGVRSWPKWPNARTIYSYTQMSTNLTSWILMKVMWRKHGQSCSISAESLLSLCFSKNSTLSLNVTPSARPRIMKCLIRCT